MDILKNTAGNILSYNGTPLGTTWSAAPPGPIYDTSTWIPTMTSRTAPSPLVSNASSTWDNASGDSGNDRYCSYRAFDLKDGLGSPWISYNTSVPHWVNIDLGDGQEIAIWKYSITARDSAESSPESFLFQGSQNSSDWDTLDTQTGLSGWVATTIYYFEIDPAPTTAYRYYRYYVTATQGPAIFAAAYAVNIYKYTP